MRYKQPTRSARTFLLRALCESSVSPSTGGCKTRDATADGQPRADRSLLQQGWIDAPRAHPKCPASMAPSLGERPESEAEPAREDHVLQGASEVVDAALRKEQWSWP
mmetsp:Transcript_86835/g.271793  ORF Transcript_86835/g.271793 Transcript_86835/m.271793 type:complete len:107 (-) Transcript_86835:112-432(-)